MPVRLPLARPRPRLPMAFVAAALLPLVLPAGAAEARSSTCADRASVTFDSSPQVRVYSVGRSLYACAYRTGRRYRLNRLARGSEFRAVGDPVVAGRYVAVTLGVEAPDHRTETVYVRDVQRGRWLHRRVPAVVDEPGFPHGDGAEINSMVLDSAGRAAWIVDYAVAPEGRLRTQVVRLGRDRGRVLLDAGDVEGAERIDSASLAITQRFAAARLFWMHGGSPRTATMR